MFCQHLRLNFTAYFMLQLLCSVPYFGTNLPNSVAAKIIKNYLRKICSALVPKRLVKLIPIGSSRFILIVIRQIDVWRTVVAPSDIFTHLILPKIFITFTRESFLKGKAQYSWPPHLGSLFVKKDEQDFNEKKQQIYTSQYTEVSGTAPSPSVSVPCPHPFNLLRPFDLRLSRLILARNFKTFCGR